MEGYKKLGDILVYRLSLELCEMGWGVYNQLGWQNKKIVGDQYIRSVDSVFITTPEARCLKHVIGI